MRASCYRYWFPPIIFPCCQPLVALALNWTAGNGELELFPASQPASQLVPFIVRVWVIKVTYTCLPEWSTSLSRKEDKFKKSTWLYSDTYYYKPWLSCNSSLGIDGRPLYSYTSIHARSCDVLIKKPTEVCRALITQCLQLFMPGLNADSIFEDK